MGFYWVIRIDAWLLLVSFSLWARSEVKVKHAVGDWAVGLWVEVTADYDRGLSLVVLGHELGDAGLQVEWLSIFHEVVFWVPVQVCICNDDIIPRFNILKQTNQANITSLKLTAIPFNEVLIVNSSLVAYLNTLFFHPMSSASMPLL